jgi:hypothetical protein
MVDTTVPYQVVAITEHYSISGGLFLRERRLSDFLNDKRDSSIMLRNVTVSRLEEPAKVLEKVTFSVVPKTGIELVFEPPQKTTPAGRQYVKYPKQKYDVFLALDGMEVRGKMNVQGPLNLQHTIANLAESFLPITEAVVTFKVNPALILKREAVLINVQRIRFLGELEQKTPADENT